MAKTIFKVPKLAYVPKSNAVVRIDPALYNEMCLIKIRTGLPIGRVADQLIRSALSDYVIEYEGGEE